MVIGIAMIAIGIVLVVARGEKEEYERNSERKYRPIMIFV